MELNLIRVTNEFFFGEDRLVQARSTNNFDECQVLAARLKRFLLDGVNSDISVN